MTPVYKKGNKADVSNYRPILILPLISKIFERAINHQLRDFIEEQELLSRHQHGFLRSRFCQSALISLADSLFTGRQKKKHTIIAWLDYSKAFNTLDNQILFNKLAALGMSSKALSWFQSYLSNCRQCVKYNGVLSDYEQIAHGIPDGSVLEPTMFINDFVLSHSDSSDIAYANITVTASDTIIDSAKLHLQDLLNVIYTWSARNSLHLNIAKCFVMHVMPSLC